MLNLGFRIAPTSVRQVPAAVESAITISLDASRTSGVAPLYVQFDAIGTICDGVTLPFHQLSYLWDYGDDTPTFSGGARGPVASHVYDQPGTYSVSLMVVSANGDIALHGMTITVSDPDTVYSGTNTVAVSTGVDFTGAPSGCVQVTSSDFDATVATYLANGKRVLLKRGDTFVASGTVNITITSGSATLGAWGTIASSDARGIASNAPIVQMAHDAVAITYGVGATQTTCTDVRVMDIEFNYTNGLTGASAPNLHYLGYRADQLLIYRCNDSTGLFRGWVSFGDSVPISFGGDVCTEVCVANCDIAGVTEYNFFGSLTDASFLNCAFGPNSAGSSGHVMRVQWGRRVHIAGMTFAPAAATKQSLTLRARDYVTDADIAQHFNVEGCSTTCGTVWAWHIGSESTGHDERIDDVIVDGCHFQFSTGSNNGYAIHTGGRRITMRNCSMDADSGVGLTSCRFVSVETYGLSGSQPAPDTIKVFHNTITTQTTLTGNWRIVNATAGDIETRNNILWAPNAASTTVTSGTATFTTSNNLEDVDPLFVSSSNYHLTASSPAIGYGTPVSGCLRDKDAVLRDTTAPDAGAYEYV